MKPITDDVVQSLLNGLEMREKKALKKLHQKARKADAGSGSMTANVLKFGRKFRRGGEGRHEMNNVLDLVEERRTRLSGRTTSGLFSYSAQLSGMGDI